MKFLTTTPISALLLALCSTIAGCGGGNSGPTPEAVNAQDAYADRLAEVEKKIAACSCDALVTAGVLTLEDLYVLRIDALNQDDTATASAVQRHIEARGGR